MNVLCVCFTYDYQPINLFSYVFVIQKIILIYYIGIGTTPFHVLPICVDSQQSKTYTGWIVKKMFYYLLLFVYEHDPKIIVTFLYLGILETQKYRKP